MRNQLREKCCLATVYADVARNNMVAGRSGSDGSDHERACGSAGTVDP
mgnify:CR=1 FL=1